MPAPLDFSDADLEVLARSLESDLVERKESPSARDKIAQAICAFANDLPGHGRPGVIFVGLRDDGSPSGLAVNDRLLTELGALRSDGNLLPPPAMAVSKRRVGGTEVAVVVVAPSGDPPVSYQGRIWIRVGPRRAIATRDEERILVERRRALDLPFDHRSVRGATLGELYLDRVREEYIPQAVAPEILAENHRGVEHQLAALHLADVDGSPTIAALLLFGRRPRHWVPGAYVQFVRFAGTDVTDPISDQKEIEGPLPEVLRRLDDITDANIQVATEVGSLHVERRSPDYPRAALQQVLRNAVMHRTYESSHAPVQWYWFVDRVEIRNPGGLFGRVSPENFGDPGATDYRNPALAAGMKVLGFVQRFGMGIPLTGKACKDNGNPPPEYEFTRSGVKVVIRTALRARLLMLDTRASAAEPDEPRFERSLRVPAGASLDLDRRLRARPLDRAAWETALAATDGAVGELADRYSGTLHAAVMAPYPLAAWLGRCLDQHARSLKVVIRQSVPGAGRWLTLDGGVGGDHRAEPAFEQVRRSSGAGSGRGVVLSLEGASRPEDAALSRLAVRVGAAEILRLVVRPGTGREDSAHASSMLADLRALLLELARGASGGPYHVVSTAPVALLVELGRVLAPTSAGPVIVYMFDPATREHYPVLDISTGRLE